MINSTSTIVKLLSISRAATWMEECWKTSPLNFRQNRSHKLRFRELILNSKWLKLNSGTKCFVDQT